MKSRKKQATTVKAPRGIRYGLGYREGQKETGAHGEERHGLGYHETPDEEEVAGAVPDEHEQGYIPDHGRAEGPRHLDWRAGGEPPKKG